ncbi:hypothetical protein ACFVT1_36445 [Streptomyces sp. NPDC057963]|uniref:hypothetical protein n=1 Tax=Streptomyces sp. NPDC057963 TaxID=3346290 RepID=UPI0036EAE664
MTTADEIRTNITECEKKVARLERTWHLHNSHFDRENAASELSGLVQYVARQREELVAVEAAERATQATVGQLTAAATRSGNPAAVAVAYVVSGVTVTSDNSSPGADEDLHRVVPVDEPLYGPTARAMRDALRKTTAHNGDSDPDADEALRRARQRPGARTASHLSAVGTHFATHRPADPMTEAARMTVTLRTAGSADAARTILRRLPFPAGGVTRGEYGHRVLTQAGGAR